MVIDAHQHLGESALTGRRQTTDAVLAALDRHGVDAALLLPYPVTTDPRRAHDAVAEACRRYPDRFVGGACLSPLVPGYTEEMRRCVRDLGFRAIKFHPMCHAMSPMYERARAAFQAAADLRVPLIIHTGRGVPHSLPSLAIPRALEFPSVAIVLAHAGYGMYTPEALVAAVVCPNIYLETSWCHVEDIRGMIARIGAGRVMMGSDGLENLPVELAKYSALGLSDETRGQVLGLTAAGLFGIRTPVPKR